MHKIKWFTQNLKRRKFHSTSTEDGDLHYIRNYSLWMDLILIVLTPKVLFMKESTEGVGEGEINANNKDK